MDPSLFIVLLLVLALASLIYAAFLLVHYLARLTVAAERIFGELCILNGRPRPPRSSDPDNIHTGLLLLLVASGAFASSPAEAARAAWKDAQKLPERERYYFRYLYWPRSWSHAPLLTKAAQALRSDQGALPRPVEVSPGVFRLDVRESGWDKRLLVWEKFLDIDVYFHEDWKFLEDVTITVYYPAGLYNGSHHNATYAERSVRAGETIRRPAQDANPWVDLGPDKKGRAQDELRRILNTEVPILFGPQFLTSGQRQVGIRNVQEGVGPYDWLGLKNRDDLFRLAGVDERTAIRLYAEWRAVIEKSGISQQNRQIVLLRGASGFMWGTLDTFREQGRGIAKRNLRRGEFDHDAEEWVLRLPWGGPFGALVAAKDVGKIKAGDLVESAPDKIGPDDSILNTSRDHRVHTDISCWRCHGIDRDWVKPFDDWVRRQHRRNKALLVDSNKAVVLELESAYLRDIEKLAKADRAEYADAIARLTSSGDGDPGLTVAGFSRIWCEAWNQYVQDPVTLDIACAEMGVEVASFLPKLRAYQDKRGQVDLVLGVFLDATPGTLTRLEWEDSVRFASAIQHGYAVPEIYERRAKK